MTGNGCKDCDALSFSGSMLRCDYHRTNHTGSAEISDLKELAGYAECLFFQGMDCSDANPLNDTFKEEGGWCQVCELKKELKIYPFNK